MKKLFLLTLCAALLTACADAPAKKDSPLFGKGELNPYCAHFTGNTYLAPLNGYDEQVKLPAANVTFEPCARTDWHKHTGGQVLLVTNGEGRHQIRGQKVEILHPGDVVSVPPGVEHWHGAAPDSWFSHVALTPNAPDNQPIWLEKVTDEEYK